MINIIRYRYWYFLFSLLIIVPGFIFFVSGGLKLGIDFTGGTELTLRCSAARSRACISRTRFAARCSATPS